MRKQIYKLIPFFTTIQNINIILTFKINMFFSKQNPA